MRDIVLSVERMNLSFSSGWRIFWCGWHCSWNWFGNRLSPTFTLIRSGIKPRVDGKYNLYLFVLASISFNQQRIFISYQFLKIYRALEYRYLIICRSYICEIDKFIVFVYSMQTLISYFYYIRDVKLIENLKEKKYWNL